MFLQHPAWLLLGLVLALALVTLRKRHWVGTSSVSLLRNIRSFNGLAKLPTTLFCIGLALLIVALCGPVKSRQFTERTFRSRDIMVGVDASHSMTEQWDDAIPPVVLNAQQAEEFSSEETNKQKSLKTSPEAPFRKPEDLKKAIGGQRRIDAAQACIVQFVLNRSQANAGDRVGVLIFDLDPRLSWPLTHDLKQIYRKGAFLAEEALNGGTNFGETGPGPIDLAAQHFAEFGKARTRVLILLTDGEAEMSSRTKERLAKLVREQDIKLYLIALGPQLLDPSRHTEIGEFTEAWADGKIFRANSSSDLQRCFDSIDKMERSEVQVQTRQEVEPLFTYFVAGGLLFLATSLLIGCFVVEV